MKIAIVAAGFTAAEADELRRAMATFRNNGNIEAFRDRFISGMTKNGYARDFTERCFKQIEGFGTYGFPESHAASFAKLVYISSWLKCHYPAVFACALLNSQPMGFYAPAQIVRDAREHDVELRPIDVNYSAWENLLEPLPAGGCALRLGFREIKGLPEEDTKKIETVRLKIDRHPRACPADPSSRSDNWFNGGEVRDTSQPSTDVGKMGPRDKPADDDCDFSEGGFSEGSGSTEFSLYAFWRRTGIRKASLVKLAEADAFGSLGLSRRQALWEAQRVKDAPLPLFAALERDDEDARPETEEAQVTLPAMPESTEVVEDYRSIGLSLKNHPFAFLRDDLTAMRCRPSRDIPEIKHGTRTRVAGMVLVRQRPGSASGVIFITLEDEFGIVNIIVWPSLFDRFRREILTSKFLAVEGKLQREGLVVHIVAEKLANITHLAEKLDPESREFTLALAHADQVARPGGDQRELIVRRRKELAAAAERLKIKSRDFH
jgi:error-prone DNA polymerase